MNRRSSQAHAAIYVHVTAGAHLLHGLPLSRLGDRSMGCVAPRCGKKSRWPMRWDYAASAATFVSRCRRRGPVAVEHCAVIVGGRANLIDQATLDSGRRLRPATATLATSFDVSSATH
jgi:hypothetical protein